MVQENINTLQYEINQSAEGVATLTLHGRLDATTTGEAWRAIQASLEAKGVNAIAINASGVNYCDCAGIGLLFELQRRQHAAGGSVEIVGLAEEFEQLLKQFAPEEFIKSETLPPAPMHLFGEVGKGALKLWEDFFLLVAYAGELSAALFHVVIHPTRVRWKEALLTAERAGANALPIVLLIGFLMGLIMAFQSAVLLREFGVEIFVANLVGKSMVRELGPLMTAILLAGRTGSAFCGGTGRDENQ